MSESFGDMLDVVKLRHAVAPAVLATPRGLTPRMEPVMQSEYTSALAAAFWSSIDRNGPVPAHRPELGPCWIWTGHVGVDGYGRLFLNSQTVLAHHAGYILAKGPIPDGLVIDHICHNGALDCTGGPTCCHRRCPNPDHLEAITNRENTLRGMGFGALNAAKTHCPEGHAYDDQRLIPSAEHGGRGQCRICAYERNRARYQDRRREQGLPLPRLEPTPAPPNPNAYSDERRAQQPRGSGHRLAKLTDDQVREIRRRAEAGETRKALSVEFGVSDVLVSKIVRRQAWGHVE